VTTLAYNDEQRPQLTLEEETDETFGRIVAEPLEAGFGITIGNALRRTLLSALPGTAITAVRIEGVEHEFTTLPHMKEDVVEFLLNVKDIRIRSLTDRPGKMFLDASGEGEVTAGQIQQTADYEIVNPELHLATLDSPEARLSIEFNVEQGRGYVPAGQLDGTTIGVIPIDAIFSPVRKVNYHVVPTRVGQETNYDKLTLEVWTDGSVTPQEAVAYAARVLQDQLFLFSELGAQPLRPPEEAEEEKAPAWDERLFMPVEQMGLSVRSAERAARWAGARTKPRMPSLRSCAASSIESRSAT